MTPCLRRGRCIVAVVCALFGAYVVVHAQSAVDGFNPGANDSVYDIAVQADGKILVVGAFTQLGYGGTFGLTTRNRIGRLNADGSLDTSFDPGASFYVYAVAVQADGKILVAGGFGKVGGGTGTTVRHRIARFNTDGTVDPDFDPGADSIVDCIAVQADGKILVGGYFTALGGGTGTTPRNHIGRLNADGSVDPSFNPGANSNVRCIAVQPDGKILVGGDFTALGDGTGTTSRNHIGRLNADGLLDTGFFPGANAAVNVIAVQPDGKIVVGGDFTGLGDGTGTTPRNYLGRLYANGTVEAGLNPAFMDDSVYSLAVQPDGKILAGGRFHWHTGRDSLARFNTDGSLDLGFDPGPRGSVGALAVQADGKIVIGGDFASIGQGINEKWRYHIGRLYGDGSVDFDLNPGADDSVFAVAVQPDGQILVGGAFTGLSGGTGATPRSHIGRLRPDGALDQSFDPGANGNVQAVAVQADGKILVGGAFTMLGGGGTGTTQRNFLARLNANGSLDDSFNPGANNEVAALAVQADGKILVGGYFTGIGGGTASTPRSRIARLNANGSVDTGFDPGANFTVTTLAVQQDGMVLVGGAFTRLGGGGTGTTTRNRIGRLNTNGLLDTSFDPGANNGVYAVAVQVDGKILVGGTFTGLGSGTGATQRNYIGRLNPDGLLDTSFNPGANGTVRTLAVQADGKILAGGFFTGLGGVTGATPRNRIGRFNPGGSLDAGFDPDVNNWVYAVALQEDGKILVGGTFTGIGTAPRNRLGRLTNTDAAIQRLTTTGSSTVTWSRSGAGPEVWRVTFEVSTDGAVYTPLGSGMRQAGGWRLLGLSLPLYQNLFIRARGHYATGYVDGSDSIVEWVQNVYVTHRWFPIYLPKVIR